MFPLVLSILLLTNPSRQNISPPRPLLIPALIASWDLFYIRRKSASPVCPLPGRDIGTWVGQRWVRCFIFNIAIYGQRHRVTVLPSSETRNTWIVEEVEAWRDPSPELTTSLYCTHRGSTSKWKKDIRCVNMAGGDLARVGQPMGHHCTPLASHYCQPFSRAYSSQ